MKELILFRYLRTGAFYIIIMGLMPSISYAQSGYKKPNDIKLNVRVIDTATLISQNTQISLWGIEKIQSNDVSFYLKARNALENKIGSLAVTCTIKHKSKSGSVKAQCINSKEEDLSLFLLQNGYASADRAVIYDSIYEQPYLNAEDQAQINHNGIWSVNSNSQSYQSFQKQNAQLITAIMFSIGVFIVIIGVFGVYIMRGFSKIVSIQNKSVDLTVKELSLKEQEKYIIASMIDAEIKSNKSKIEAYILIYEETLREFTISDATPKYQKTGEIIQKSPGLGRAIFDNNIGKIDLFSPRLASGIIHYYARIKTTFEYIEIKPDTPRGEAQQIIEDVIENAKKLNNVSDKIINAFVNNELIKVHNTQS